MREAEGDYIEAKRIINNLPSDQREKEYLDTIVDCNLGNVYKKKGDVEQAEKLYESVRTRAKELGELSLECRALYNLGNIYLDVEKKTNEGLDKAQLCFDEMREFVDEKDISNLLLAYAGLGKINYFRGKINYYQGHFRASLNNFQTALGHARMVGDNAKIGNLYYEISKTLLELGEKDTSDQYLEKSQQIFSQINSESAEKGRKPRDDDLLKGLLN